MLFLTLATFSQTGGVQMVCRAMAKALDSIHAKDHNPFEMISLCDEPHALDSRYLRSSAFRGFSYQRTRFINYVLRRAACSDVILLAHINLLPLAWLIKRIYPGTRIILLAHGKEVWGKMLFWKKRFLNAETEIWAVSRFTKKTLAYKHHILPNRIQVLNNCLDPFFQIPLHFRKPQHLLTRYKLNANNRILLTLTRLDNHEHKKGYDLVLEGLPDLVSEFPDIRYIIAGKASAEEQGRIWSKVKSLKLEQVVILPGFVPQAELTDHHLLADIFVLPSSKEGFGLVFLEAAVCGSSIIAGNKDGSTDAVMDGALATLVDPASKLEITAALRKHLAIGTDPVAAAHRQLIAANRFSFSKYQSEVEFLLTKPAKQ